MTESSKGADAGTSVGAGSGPVATRNGALPKVAAVEIPVMRVMAILCHSPAWRVLTKAIPISPGRLIPVTQEELDSLREDCLILDVLPPA